MKFLTLNVDFSSSGADPLGSRRPAQASVEEGYPPPKSGNFAAIGLSIAWKPLHIGTDMQPIIKSNSDT